MRPYIDIYAVTTLGKDEITKVHFRVEITQRTGEIAFVVNMPDEQDSQAQEFTSGCSVTSRQKLILAPMDKS